MSPAVTTLIVLGFVAFFFITELVPLAITALAGAIVLGLLGVIPVNTVFSGLSNSTVVLFAGMFGFKERSSFDAQAGAEVAPKVTF